MFFAFRWGEYLYHKKKVINCLCIICVCGQEKYIKKVWAQEKIKKTRGRGQEKYIKKVWAGKKTMLNWQEYSEYSKASPKKDFGRFWKFRWNSKIPLLSPKIFQNFLRTTKRNPKISNWPTEIHQLFIYLPLLPEKHPKLRWNPKMNPYFSWDWWEPRIFSLNIEIWNINHQAKNSHFSSFFVEVEILK